MNIFSLKTGNLIINWLPYSYTHTMPERLAPQPDRVWKWRGFDSLPVCMKSSFIRHCCFYNDPWYVKGVTGTPQFFNECSPAVHKSKVQCRSLPRWCSCYCQPAWGIQKTHLWDCKNCEKASLSPPLLFNLLKFQNLIFWNGKKSFQHGWRKYWD